MNSRPAPLDFFGQGRLHLVERVRVSVNRLIADGDTVVADGKYTWNHKQTGEPCEVRMAHIWQLSGGKAVSFLQHVDSARVRELIE